MQFAFKRAWFSPRCIALNRMVIEKWGEDDGEWKLFRYPISMWPYSLIFIEYFESISALNGMISIFAAIFANFAESNFFFGLRFVTEMLKFGPKIAFYVTVVGSQLKYIHCVPWRISISIDIEKNIQWESAKHTNEVKRRETTTKNTPPNAMQMFLNSNAISIGTQWELVCQLDMCVCVCAAE